MAQQMASGGTGDTVALVRMNTLDEAAWCSDLSCFVSKKGSGDQPSASGVDRLNGHETAPNLQLPGMKLRHYVKKSSTVNNQC